jgi:hypothetical protein
MTALRIKFYAQNSTMPTFIDIPNDVVEVQIPAVEDRPALRINVNTDMVIVDTEDGERVAAYDYRDDVTDAGLNTEDCDYAYDSREECMEAGDHLTCSVDDDGFCDFCGEQ